MEQSGASWIIWLRQMIPLWPNPLFLICDSKFYRWKIWFFLKIERCLKLQNSESFWLILAIWRLWISEGRLAVNNGFFFVIQEILQVEDMIFTWRLRGVLNDTIWRILDYFSWNQLLINDSIVWSKKSYMWKMGFLLEHQEVS